MSCDAWRNGTPDVAGLSASSPAHRFASFVADCKPGRFINASPPWGLHELANNETTNEAALAASTVTLTAPVTSRFGTPAKTSITVTGPDDSRDGVVTIKDGAKTVGSADVVAGKATISLAGLAVGKHRLSARYVAQGRTHWTTSTPSTLSVVKAATTTTLVAPARADRKRNAVLRIRVRATGATPTGKVAIYDGTKRVRTVSVKGSTVTVKVRLKKAGQHRLRAVFAGSQVTDRSQSSVVKVRVR